MDVAHRAVAGRPELEHVGLRPGDNVRHEDVFDHEVGIVRFDAHGVVAAIDVAVADDHVLRLDVDAVVVQIDHAVDRQTTDEDVLRTLEHDTPHRRIAEDEVLEANALAFVEEETTRTPPSRIAAPHAHLREGAAVAADRPFAGDRDIGDVVAAHHRGPVAFGIGQRHEGVVVRPRRTFQPSPAFQVQLHVGAEKQLRGDVPAGRHHDAPTTGCGRRVDLRLEVDLRAHA